MLVDAHCHFDFPEFEGVREAVLRSCAEQGIERIVVPGVRQPDWSRVETVCQSDSRLFPCYGIHPWFIDEHDNQDLARLEARLCESDAVALGECGLDRLTGELDRQMPFFEAQVDLAIRFDLPLVIHSVKTHDEVVSVLRRKKPKVPILVHGFSGSPEQAAALIRCGASLGVGGVITYSRATKTRAALASVPIDHLILESDAPDMPPVGVRKGENRPEYLRQIFQCLVELLDVEPDELEHQLALNVKRLYRWQ